MAESEEALQLKRRARRRLVGAIALVTFVVIILPLIMDKEPGPPGAPLSVQIPNQDSGGFTTRVVPPSPAIPAPDALVSEKKAGNAHGAAEAPAAKAEAPAAKIEMPAAKPAAPAPKAAPDAASPTDKSEAQRAQAALNGQDWVIALDAFSDMKNVKQLRGKLSAVGIKSYTEPVKTSKGALTRVRAGPYASKEAAENAHAKLVKMGLKPGAVTSR